jgi:hypothetical protein
MGNAITTKHLRALSIALLGLLIIGVSLATEANAAPSCTSEVRLSESGDYEGCLVKMGNREFIVGSTQSSAEGCSQVCNIMAEVGGKISSNPKRAQALNTLIR